MQSSLLQHQNRCHFHMQLLRKRENKYLLRCFYQKGSKSPNQSEAMVVSGSAYINARFNLHVIANTLLKKCRNSQTTCWVFTITFIGFNCPAFFLDAFPKSLSPPFFYKWIFICLYLFMLLKQVRFGSKAKAINHKSFTVIKLYR